MALAKELMGYPLITERSSLVSSASHFKKRTQSTQFSINPFDRRPRKTKSGVVAAISEDLVKTLRFSTTTGDRKSEEEEKAAVKFKVRAVVTVRNKNKEDLKETLVKHLDAFADKIGRNIVLELISTQLDPSKSFSWKAEHSHIFWRSCNLKWVSKILRKNKTFWFKQKRSCRRKAMQQF